MSGVRQPSRDRVGGRHQSGSTTANNATGAGSTLTAWKKPHNFNAYYGSPLQTPDTNGTKGGNEEHTKHNDTQAVETVQHGYSVPNYRPPPSVPQSEIKGPTHNSALEQGQRSHPGPTLSAVQQGKAPSLLQPHLQVLCGPMLRYDTVKDDMWYGAVMIVTNDSESIYNPFPTLTVEWEPETETPFILDVSAPDTEGSTPPVEEQAFPGLNNPESDDMDMLLLTPPPKSPLSDESSGLSSFETEDEEELASPSSPSSPSSRSRLRSGTWASSMVKKLKGLKLQSGSDDFRGRPPERIAQTERAAKEKQRWANKRIVEGEAIYKYAGIATMATFWRFMLEVPVNPDPSRGMKVHYAINKPNSTGSGAQSIGPTDITFHIAPTGSDMRFAAYSCNGFSETVDQNAFKGEGFSSGFDPVWADLLQRHEERPFHALVGGGDQIYCDSLMKEPELQDYIKLQKREQKIAYPLTEDIAFMMDRFYFNHYCLTFRSGCFGRAISQIPMVNMLDDHDIIDGFGSYPEDLQRSPFFKHVGARGYFWYLLFQLFTVDGVDGTLLEPGQHTFKSMIIGADGPWIPFPSHSGLHWFGYHTYLLMLDCRAERRQDVILSPDTYRRVFAILSDLPSHVNHLIVQLGIPIAYPRMNLTEKLMHPDGLLAKMSRSGVLPGLANKYNKDIELLDDLSDHWTAKQHKRERNWFISQLQYIAKAQQVRISFISGDVHLASVGLFKTHQGKVKQKVEVEPALDHRWMLNVISSAIVNTPPPNAVQAMMNALASHKHRTMHKEHTDEVMLPIFREGLHADKKRLNYIAGSRNYTICERDPSTGEMVFNIRVERHRGRGETKGYVVRAPPPKWAAD